MSNAALNSILAITSAGPTRWEPFGMNEFLDAFVLKTLLARESSTPAATLALLTGVEPKRIHQSLRRLERAGLVDRRGRNEWAASLDDEATTEINSTLA